MAVAGIFCIPPGPSEITKVRLLGAIENRRFSIPKIGDFRYPRPEGRGIALLALESELSELKISP